MLLTSVYLVPAEREVTVGSSYIASNGYVVVTGMKGHPMASARGVLYEHRLVMSKKLDRTLTRREVVHHINGVKTDNRPENLELVASQSIHVSQHRGPHSRVRLPGEKNATIRCSCLCSKKLKKYDRYGRPRMFIKDHGGRTTVGIRERREAIRKLYAEMPNQSKVAMALGISRGTVARHVKGS